MKVENEVNADFYCMIGAYVQGEGCNFYGCGIPSQATKTCTEFKCGYYRHKWPTPEQYKEEYGEEYPDAGAVWAIDDISGTEWQVLMYGEREYIGELAYIVCVCTPFGRPPKDWRPQ